VDPAYVAKALKDLGRLRHFLESVRPLSGARLEHDFALRLAVLHALQLAIQIVLDVGAHLLASTAGGPVEEYSQIGPRLAEAGVVSAELGASLAPMARFRNLLVHQYADVDLDRVVAIVATGLGDLEAFDEAVRTHLKRADPA
jgi:uncharacterized protein YutE (UPF0331/DUF86 family)